MAEWWPYDGRAQVVYIGLLPETVCLPCSGLIVAVYRPYTGRIQADSVLVVAVYRPQLIY